jgi:hypothetical protein
LALSDDTEAYAAYLNGHAQAIDQLRPEELEEYEADMAKARRAMEVAWLERAAGGALIAGPRVPPLSRPAFDPEIGITTTQPDGW